MAKRDVRSAAPVGEALERPGAFTETPHARSISKGRSSSSSRPSSRRNAPTCASTRSRRSCSGAFRTSRPSPPRHRERSRRSSGRRAFSTQRRDPCAAWPRPSCRSTAVRFRARWRPFSPCRASGARGRGNVVLGNVWGTPDGVVVDTHVGRLARRLGWTRQTDAVKAERDLNRIIPKERWTWISHALIQHGRRICTARRPQCERCTLADICPKVGVEKKKRERK